VIILTAIEVAMLGRSIASEYCTVPMASHRKIVHPAISLPGLSFARAPIPKTVSGWFACEYRVETGNDKDLGIEPANGSSLYPRSVVQDCKRFYRVSVGSLVSLGSGWTRPLPLYIDRSLVGPKPRAKHLQLHGDWWMKAPSKSEGASRIPQITLRSESS
jgi:hypothetical protein